MGEREEFQKWALAEGFVREVVNMPDPHIWQAWQASQENTLRRMQKLVIEHTGTYSDEVALSAAIDREFSRAR